MPTWEALGGRDRGRRYRSFVEAGVEQEIAAYYANQRAAPILGDERFRQWALGWSPERSEVPAYTRRRFRAPAAIIEAAAAASGLARAELTARGRASARA